MEFLYYYDIPGSTFTAPYVQMISFAGAGEYEAWVEAVIAKFEGEKPRAVAGLPMA